MTFTPADWNVPQTVTVTGVDDVAVDGPQSTTIRVAVSDAASDDGFDPLADRTLTATTADDDTAGFIVTESGGATAVSETGTTDTVAVVLTTQPVSPVVISISSSNPAEAAVNQTSLIFNAGNWNVPQAVTVTGVDDGAVNGTRTTTITAAIAAAEFGRRVRRTGRADRDRHDG